MQPLVGPESPERSRRGRMEVGVEVDVKGCRSGVEVEVGKNEVT